MPATREVTRLAALFGDHAVLQQGRPVSVWGWDVAGRGLAVSLRDDAGGVKASATCSADASGRFRAVFPALAAGGPYELSVEGSTRVLLRDVWVGEVWLASGQSNMEWRLAASLDAEREIAAAALPRLRMFKVQPRASREPCDEASGAWAVCSPASAGDFSAVAYFFARAVHEARGVAVGVVDATWGGTCIEAWTSGEALAPVLPDLDAQREALASELARLPELRADYERALAAWQRENLPVDARNLGFERGFARPGFDTSRWPTMALPAFWQSHGLAFNGVVWFRRSVELPPSFAGQRLVLSLGALDDFDDTYFGGVAVGRTAPGTVNAHQTLRRYEVPAELVREGRNVIAVRVFDHFGDGGFAGPSSELYIERADGAGERLRLSGDWQYCVEREIPLVPMDVFRTLPPAPLALALQNAPAALFNGMIAPLVPHALRGIIWYQGESNTARHAHYAALHLALVRDWRTRFGQGLLPFYFVQLANHRATPDWPKLREAQARLLCEPETGMVVSIDVGDPNDIHPRNKRAIGHRLSLLARARTYGESGVVADGPALAGLDIRGSEVHVRFANALGLRCAKGEAPRGFELAAADGRYVAAAARIQGDTVVLSSAAVPEPVAVRYAWADDPDANLENGAGLPAAPFRTDAA